MANDEKRTPFNSRFKKIGDSDYRFDVWYKVSDKSKIPFGWHVKQEEIDKCENILFAFDFYKSDYLNEFKLEVMFFMDSREYGCGGYVSSVPEIGFDEDLQKHFEELLQRSADKIKGWGLEVNKEKLLETIQDLENQKRDIDRSIVAMKQVLENS